MFRFTLLDRVTVMNTVLEAGNKISYPLIFLILALLFYFSYRYVIPTEDSVILYDYSKHLATEGVITYGNANYPIEGATDFLWMALIALFKLVGFNEFASAQLFNFLAALLIMYLLSKFGVKIAVAFVGLLATPYLYSALNGFSTLFFAAALPQRTFGVFIWP